jgi:hypothetical protein
MILKHGVRALLMGGQACVFYGAAEFSRNADLVIVADSENLDRLRAALGELKATRIFVPEPTEEFLRRGHAVHFRCTIPEVNGIRVDVMSILRGVDSFDRLWQRRTTIADDAGNAYELLSLADLVKAKKTQRDKDWPMVTRLLEAKYAENKDASTQEQVGFWLREMRTPKYLIDIARRFPSAATESAAERLLLHDAIAGDGKTLETALAREQAAEQERDKEYWRTLRAELEQLRRART